MDACQYIATSTILVIWNHMWVGLVTLDSRTLYVSETTPIFEYCLHGKLGTSWLEVLSCHVEFHFHKIYNDTNGDVRAPRSCGDRWNCDTDGIWNACRAASSTLTYSTILGRLHDLLKILSLVTGVNKICWQEPWTQYRTTMFWLSKMTCCIPNTAFSAYFAGGVCNSYWKLNGARPRWHSVSPLFANVHHEIFQSCCTWRVLRTLFFAGAQQRDSHIWLKKFRRSAFRPFAWWPTSICRQGVYLSIVNDVSINTLGIIINILIKLRPPWPT